MLKSSILFFLLILGISGFSQTHRGWELGGWGGVSYYFGDLNTSLNLSQPGPGLGVSGRFNFNPRLSLSLSANYGRVEADDAKSSNEFERARNLNFKSNIFEGSLQMEFNFLKYIHGSKDYPFTPYLLGGFSVFQFNPTTRIDGVRYALRDLGTEGQFFGEEYFLIQPAMTYGFGFKMDLNSEWSVNIELSARRLFTDYLDDVSGTYPDKDELLSLRGPVAVQASDRSRPEDREVFNIGQEGRQRGNDKDNDSFNFLKVGVMYYFGYLPCPDISRIRY
jgi:hypothetical protein